MKNRIEKKPRQKNKDTVDITAEDGEPYDQLESSDEQKTLQTYHELCTVTINGKLFYCARDLAAHGAVETHKRSMIFTEACGYVVIDAENTTKSWYYCRQYFEEKRPDAKLFVYGRGINSLFIHFQTEHKIDKKGKPYKP